MDRASRINETYAAIEVSNQTLIKLLQSSTAYRLTWLVELGISIGASLAMCLASTLLGVFKALEEQSGVEVVAAFVLAIIPIANVYVQQRTSTAVIKEIKASMDRYADYVMGSRLLEVRMYAASTIGMSHNPDAVLFTDADGTRYLAKEMVQHIVDMDSVGINFLKTVAAFGSCQPGEYRCVDYEFFNSTDDGAVANAQPQNRQVLPN